ncbi:MAG: hypothetical protein C4315_08265 [Chloroflexota bacterium]
MRLVLLVDDLYFRVRLADLAERLGIEVCDPDAVPDDRPVLAVVDLAGPSGRWARAVKELKARLGPKLTVLGFGPHRDVSLFRQARTAGFDHVWARSKLVTDLPAFLEKLLREAPADADLRDDPSGPDGNFRV